MSKNETVVGCKIHGPKNICGHTTSNCPDLNDLFLVGKDIPVNDQNKEPIENDFDNWKEKILEIYFEIQNNKKLLRILKKEGSQQKTADSLDVSNKIIDQSSRALDLSFKFLKQNPNLPLEERQIVEALLIELEELISTLTKFKSSLFPTA